MLFAGICAITSLPLIYMSRTYLRFIPPEEMILYMPATDIDRPTVQAETGTVDHQSVLRISTGVGPPEGFAEMGTTAAGLPLSGIGPSEKAVDAPNRASI
jgi:hypothetical protein